MQITKLISLSTERHVSDFQMKTNYLFLLVCTLSLIFIGVNGKVELADFFPFGVDHGDNIVPENDDQFVNITFSPGSVFPFFNTTHRSLFVNNNGAISFIAGTYA